jgi:hypothetical protein
MSTPEFCRLAGITPRQAQYLEEKGILKAGIRRGWRVWTDDDVARARILNRMRRAFGISHFRYLPKIRAELLAARWLLASCETGNVRLEPYTDEHDLVTELSGFEHAVAVIDVGSMRAGAEG